MAADRPWTGRAAEPALAAPFTVEAMSEALDLDSLAERRVRLLLDSLEPDSADAGA